MTTLTPHLSHPKYRPDIDGLRAVAVLSVVAFHAFPAEFKSGFIGVDIFFVISGFLISTIIFENLGKGTFSLSEFYTRRIVRIFPALLLVLLASFAFGWLALLADEYKQLGKHIAAGAGFISNLVLWNEAGYFDTSAETKPLLHLWSLGIEEQFYIIWPFVLLFAWKWRFNLLVLTVVVAMLSFALNIKGIKHDPVATFYSPQTRFWELLSGSLLAWFVLQKTTSFHQKKSRIALRLVDLIHKKAVQAGTNTLANASSSAGCLLLVYGYWCITKDVSFPGGWAAIPVLGAVLIILADRDAWINRKLLSCKVAVWFGLISFPLYLWHWPLLSFARIVEGETPSHSIRSAAVALSVVLAWLTYKLVERPIRSDRRMAIKPATLLMLMVTVGLVGAHTYRNDGYDSRASIKSYINNKNELIRMPTSEESCWAYVGLNPILFPYCRYTNAKSNKTVAVVGDSHAHAAYPGIAEFLLGQGINTVLLANSSCPPFLGSPTGNNQSELVACEDRVEQLLRVIEGKKDINKVFIFTRGVMYTTGSEPLTENKNTMGGRAIPLEQFAKSAQATIDRLASKGKLVYYVSENPELNFHPNSCLARPFNSNAKNCIVEKESVSARQSSYHNAFSTLKNVTFIDSLSAFCPNDKCLVFDGNGALLYADDDHISVAGSRFQVKKLLSPYLN